MSDGQDAEVLRGLVREVLAELLPAAPAPAAGGPTAPAQDGPVFTPRDGVRDVETVSLRTDAELAAFVTRLLHLFENPGTGTTCDPGGCGSSCPRPGWPDRPGPRTGSRRARSPRPRSARPRRPGPGWCWAAGPC